MSWRSSRPGPQPQVVCGPDRPSSEPCARPSTSIPPDRRSDPRRPRPSPWPAGCSPAPRRSRKVVVLTDGSFDGAAELRRRGGRRADRRSARRPATCGITRLPGPPQPPRPDRLRDPGRGRQRLGRPGRVPARARPRRRPDRRRAAEARPRRALGAGLREDVGRRGPSARLDRPDDALAADNTAWAILPRRDRQRVILVTPGNLFLEKVFEAIPLVDLEVVKVAKDGRRPGSRQGVASCGRRSLEPPRSCLPSQGARRAAAGPVLVIEPERPARSGSSASRSRTRWSPSRTRTRR